MPLARLIFILGVDQQTIILGLQISNIVRLCQKYILDIIVEGAGYGLKTLELS